MHLFQRDVLRSEAAPPLFVHEYVVRFQDVDAAGVVFYPRILEYFHDAYVAFLASCGLPLPEVLSEGLWLAPIRHAEADYYRPLRFGQHMRIELILAHLGESEITLGYQISCEGEPLCAAGQTVHTFVDPETFQRREVPGLLRARLVAFLARD